MKEVLAAIPFAPFSVLGWFVVLWVLFRLWWKAYKEGGTRWWLVEIITMAFFVGSLIKWVYIPLYGFKDSMIPYPGWGILTVLLLAVGIVWVLTLSYFMYMGESGVSNVLAGAFMVLLVIVPVWDLVLVEMGTHKNLWASLLYTVGNPVGTWVYNTGDGTAQGIGLVFVGTVAAASLFWLLANALRTHFLKVRLAELQEGSSSVSEYGGRPSRKVEEEK